MPEYGPIDRNLYNKNIKRQYVRIATYKILYGGNSINKQEVTITDNTITVVQNRVASKQVELATTKRRIN